MSYVKSFNDKGIWKDISLSDTEERECYQKAIMTHNQDMLNCIDDAREILKTKKIDTLPMGVITLATSLFTARASHLHYFREAAARTVFECTFQQKAVEKSDWTAKKDDIKSNVPDIEPKDSPLEQHIRKIEGLK